MRTRAASRRRERTRLVAALLAVALVGGLVAAIVLARSMADLLFGVEPFDLPSFALARHG